jgi:DNA-binding transcriptional regulator YdaS (Cro superfamily)
LDRAIECAGTMTALAEALCLTKGAIYQWKIRGGRVPAEHCPTIERLTLRRVSCEDLRPDVEWGYLRGSKKRRELA